jgi:hypothetical protein
MMFAVLVLDGYSSSFRKVKISDLVQSWLHDYREELKGERLVTRMSRSTIWRSRKSDCEWIRKHSDIADILICVGKSYGATNLLADILPNRKVQESLLYYDAVGLLTIDPNFPILKDWTPNLNQYQFKMPNYIDCATNIYVQSNKKRQQCGALVEHAENIPVRGYNHYSIIHCPDIPNQFLKMIVTLKQCRQIMRDGGHEF